MHFYTWGANYRASCGVCEPTPASGHVHAFSLPRVNVGVTINGWNVTIHSLECVNFPLENSEVSPHIVFFFYGNLKTSCKKIFFLWVNMIFNMMESSSNDWKIRVKGNLTDCRHDNYFFVCLAAGADELPSPPGGSSWYSRQIVNLAGFFFFAAFHGRVNKREARQEILGF